MLHASIIICAHNPHPEYLHRVLNALRDQTLARREWELLLIDNASDQPLKSQFDISWQPNSRHIFEVEVGIVASRRRGIYEASADLIVFVDDDTILDPDYLLKATRIKNDWPLLGAWGSGSITGEFERTPSSHVKSYLMYLGLRETATPQWSNIFSCAPATPWGAGLCLRADVAKAYSELYDQLSLQITSRRGRDPSTGELLSGEDVEICIVACKLGFGTGVFPELKLTHLIPKVRVSDDYLVKIMEGTRFSNMLLDFKWRGVIPRSSLSMRGLLSIAKNILLSNGIDRRMYFATFRATIRARRIIAQSQGNRVPIQFTNGIGPQQ